MGEKHFIIRISVLVLFALTVAACATMDQAECETANWYDVGIGDGEHGRASRRYQDYRDDCAEFGVSVDTKAYREGWETGIARYCTRDNGYRVGINGVAYQDSCPAEYEDAFFSAYQLGRAVHTHRHRVDELHHEIEEVGDELEMDDLTEDKRNSLRDKRKRLKKDLEREEWALLAAASEARSHGFAAP